MTRKWLIDLSRDWRIRTLVPVLLINVGAFIGLYKLMYHYAIENLVTTQKLAASAVLDEVVLGFQERAHGEQALAARLARQAEVHDLSVLNAYDGAGQPMVSTRGNLTMQEMAQARIVLIQPKHPTMWLSEGKASVLYGVRALQNTDACRSCHETNLPLGAIQLGIDLTGPMRDARNRVNRNFAMAGLAWFTLLALMFWAGGVVIGRPLRNIENSLSATGSKDAATHDLDRLANRLNDTIWDLINSQREREADIARHMVRAEQLASLGQLAAGLTHEIKNPLAGVIAALELFRDEVDVSSQNSEVYDQMLGELRRVVGTLESLLRLAKPHPLQRSPVDLSRVVREVTSLFAARLRRQGITLDVTIGEEIPLIAVDSGLIAQLLVNLLTNSMQASDRGATITVLLAPFPRHDGVALAVSDTGKGIAAEKLDRVFEPFFTTKEEGTGLGLAICRQTVEQHGGTINIESEPGRGTRVVVLLPQLELTEGQELEAANG